ncbi:MAG: hypothetical protein RBS57_02475, partial [Desulforhabdus sp.]|nr:hypothetical protein [Desulforhabdus sp.]
SQIPTVLDSFLIIFYRLSSDAMANFLLGTLILAMISVVVGELTLSLALRFNRRHIQGMEDELEKQHQLSMAALQIQDQKGYKACNKQANDMFGKYFFNMIAYSAACLWPVPFALAWMQTRFLGVEFPLAYPLSLVWPSTQYFTIFLSLYILARIIFKHLRPYLPYFKQVQKTLDLSAEIKKQPLKA